MQINYICFNQVCICYNYNLVISVYVKQRNCDQHISDSCLQWPGQFINRDVGLTVLYISLIEHIEQELIANESLLLLVDKTFQSLYSEAATIFTQLPLFETRKLRQRIMGQIFSIYGRCYSEYSKTAAANQKDSYTKA